MVWTCTDERRLLYWEKDAGNGAARKEDNGKAYKVRESMAAIEVTKEDAEEKTEWRRIIRCDDP